MEACEKKSRRILSLFFRKIAIVTIDCFSGENGQNEESKPFVLNCPKCATPFSSLSQLDEHLEVEHEVTTDTPDDEHDDKKIVVSN